MNEIPTTPSFYMDAMFRDGHLQKEKVRLTHATPDTSTGWLADASSDVGALLWFPRDVLNIAFKHCQAVGSPRSDLFHLDNVILLQSSIIQDRSLAKALNCCVRFAWAALIDNPDFMKKIVSQLLDDRFYVEKIRRISGFLPDMRPSKTNFSSCKF